jgi:hypothetical protein
VTGLDDIRRRLEGTPALRAFPDILADVERLLAIAEAASNLYDCATVSDFLIGAWHALDEALVALDAEELA